jgi:hypothetical protein
MHPLDNPIWQALLTTHAGFAETCNERESSLVKSACSQVFPNQNQSTTILSPLC